MATAATYTHHTDHRGTTLHVRFEGRSDELTFGTLGLDPWATDEAIKGAVARYYERKAHTFDGYVVVRYAQAVVLRPEAIYG